MFEIPAWAIGVAAICGGVGVMVVLMQLGDGLARSLFGSRAAKGRGPKTVIGMHVGAEESAPNQAVLDDLQRRVAELEERLDFTERVLAQRPDPEKLMPPR